MVFVPPLGKKLKEENEKYLRGDSPLDRGESPGVQTYARLTLKTQLPLSLISFPFVRTQGTPAQTSAARPRTRRHQFRAKENTAVSCSKYQEVN